MKKALMNATVATMIYRFNMSNIEELERLGYQVDVSCNWGKENAGGKDELSAFKSILEEKNIHIINTTCPRSVLSFGKIFSTYFQLKKLAEQEHYDLVHTQTAISGAICRLAFRKARKKGTKVIYTAHGFHFYQSGPLLSWLLFYPIEKICSNFTDVLITINQEDFNFARKKMKNPYVVYVPGVGIDLKKFSPFSGSPTEAEKKKALRETVGCSDNDILLLSVGELNANKNHQIIIQAIAGLKNKRIHYAIAGTGSLEQQLIQQAKTLGIADQIHCLGFRTDVNNWYKAADIFIHPSKREGLPVSIMEAMASGLPCIGSRTRGITDLIVEGKGGYLANPQDVGEFQEKIYQMIKASDSISTMGSYNRQIVKKFANESVREQMRQIYQNFT